MKDTTQRTVELHELPRGWVWARLSDLRAREPNAMTDGPFGSHLKTSDYTQTGVQVVRLGNVGVGRFVEEDRAFVSEAKYSLLTRHEAFRGDLVIAALAYPVGRACMIPASLGRAIVKADCVRFKVHPALSALYVMHCLNSPGGRDRAERMSHGVGRLRINMQEMRNLPLPLPPLPEQHRIVAEIEKHFTRLEAAVAALEQVRAHLKRYRAAVLKAACEGRLVPTEADLARAEGRTYEPAEELLARILKERRARWEADQLAKMQARGKVPKDDKWMATCQEPAPPDAADLPELPEGWLWSALGAIADVRLGKMLSPKAYSDGRLQLPYLRNENVRWGSIDFGNVKKMGFKQSELQRYRLESGDLVVCEGGEAGRCAVYAGAPGQFMYQKALHRVRPFGRLVNSHFIQFCFQHYVASGSVIPRPSETTIQHLPLEKVVVLPVPLPPLAEQHRIVAEVERRLSVIDELDAVVDANLKRAERLRQAILKRAFDGKLVPQDPNDEPASVLLERIRAERGALAYAAKTRLARRTSPRKGAHTDAATPG